METNDKTTAMPTLTLDPFGAQAAAEQQTAAAEPVKTCDELMQENSNLSADELAAVDAFAKQIDITNSAQIMCSGTGREAEKNGQCRKKNGKASEAKEKAAS